MASERHRDNNGEISRKHGNILIRTLRIVAGLKRFGADTAEALRLLFDLLELQQLREQRLARVRLQRRR